LITAALAAASTPLLLPNRVLAVTSWVAGDGSWSVAANWSPAAVPPLGDAVVIAHSDAVNRLITFDFDYPSNTGISTLLINQTGTGVSTLSIGANRLRLNGIVTIGSTGHGAVV
jgi:hypothetical protein